MVALVWPKTSWPQELLNVALIPEPSCCKCFYWTKQDGRSSLACSCQSVSFHGSGASRHCHVMVDADADSLWCLTAMPILRATESIHHDTTRDS